MAARHLSLLGFSPVLFYPKRTDKALFTGLVTQCTKMGLPFVEAPPRAEQMDSDYGLVVDALFGFSFKPPVRPGFVDVLRSISKSKVRNAKHDLWRPN